MRPRLGWRRLPVGLLLASLLVGAGCATRSGITSGANAVALSTSTTAAAAEGSPFPAARSAADIQSSLQAAVTARDFCQLVAALDTATPEEGAGAAMVALYRELSVAVRAARAWLPPDLPAVWNAVVRATGRAASAAKAAKGDPNTAVIRAAFSDIRFQEAMDLVEAWADRSCTPAS